MRFLAHRVNSDSDLVYRLSGYSGLGITLLRTGAPEVDIGRRQIVEALVVTGDNVT